MNMESSNEHPSHKMKIMVVDDHPVVREGLVQLINHEGDLNVSVLAETADQALAAMDTELVDLAVVDISLAGTNGIDLTKKLVARFPNMPILILTMHDELGYLKRAFCSGARGYITKQDAAENIVVAIRRLLGGKKYISDRMLRKYDSTDLGCSNWEI
jgi:DNA-binding NarL/FixJ family response regulator